MSNIDVVRAWKDTTYYNSLTEAERTLVPDNPVGLVSLDDADLLLVVGGVEVATINEGTCAIGSLGCLNTAECGPSCCGEE